MNCSSDGRRTLQGTACFSRKARPLMAQMIEGAFMT
jgi:hypothetical protein